MISKLHEQAETPQERIDRLRKSVEWFNAHGDTMQEQRYRAKLIQAEREELRRASILVGIPRDRILKRMLEIGTQDAMAAALDIAGRTGFLDSRPD